MLERDRHRDWTQWTTFASAGNATLAVTGFVAAPMMDVSTSREPDDYVRSHREAADVGVLGGGQYCGQLPQFGLGLDRLPEVPMLQFAFSLLACLGPDSGGVEALTAIDDDGDGYTSVEDCDDANAAVHPDANEIRDGSDDDCDTLVDGDDESLAPWSGRRFDPDEDGDGFGDANANAVRACEPPAGLVSDARDCDDGIRSDDRRHGDDWKRRRRGLQRRRPLLRR